MEIEEIFRSLYGKPCWNVRPGHGSFLTLEFGQPHLVVREPSTAVPGATKKVREAVARRLVTVRGDWHLWIYCCDWKVFKGGTLIGDSSTDARIARAGNFLDGQGLTRFTISRRDVSYVFEFDLGGKLRTRPYNRHSEQWMLFEPSGMVLTVRADARYKYSRSDAPEKEGEWIPIRA
jgi:hypothetical protein